MNSTKTLQNTGASCSIGSTSLDCINVLTPDELNLLQQHTVDVRYAKGEMLCKQGTFAAHIMILNNGLLKSFIESGNESLILQIFAPVSVVGLASLYEGSNVFHHSVQAYLDSDVSLIEINALRELIKSNGNFASKIISIIAEQKIITSGRFYCLTKKQTYGRFADVLLCLANRIYKTQKIPVQLSRRDFAELSGMSVETIARILTKFKTDGLIELTNDYIEILDYETLALISQKG
ncbi:MAG: Crp/Fnr family transcriptional regulator [Bacteroidetes bacterium]|nr:Crp/Fnr family transcriptional regulator [Bacteroidota bacterium]